MAHALEIALQRGEEDALGAALEDLAEEGAARHQDLARESEGRFGKGDAYFAALSNAWSEGTRQVFAQLPELPW